MFGISVLSIVEPPFQFTNGRGRQINLAANQHPPYYYNYHFIRIQGE